MVGILFSHFPTWEKKNQNWFTTKHCRKKTNWGNANQGVICIYSIWFVYSLHVCGLVEMSPREPLLHVTELEEH